MPVAQADPGSGVNLPTVWKKPRRISDPPPKVAKKVPPPAPGGREPPVLPAVYIFPATVSGSHREWPVMQSCSLDAVSSDPSDHPGTWLARPRPPCHHLACSAPRSDVPSPKHAIHAARYRCRYRALSPPSHGRRRRLSDGMRWNNRLSCPTPATPHPTPHPTASGRDDLAEQQVQGHRDPQELGTGPVAVRH